ncbi:hypothetical protein CspeluHIS016_0501140 [Cutaneotrichosporon spelunceum]|uniref:Ricin B lectin domain-containing protein n=1 Tax=Cutaneotrichosporon spelunceum TaxID=1672016 RepID=A0AAD3TWD8_9TREE|nr:hypothetical protein CspeluHIS016_0501140 [Cutaneotrichosporon spelunceum]
MLFLALLSLAAASPTPRAFIPPGASLVSIHPHTHADRCLDVAGGVHNMNDVVIAPCSDAASQQWYVLPGAPTYILSSVDHTLCVDAGTNPLAGYHPSNGAGAKLMLCPSDNWPSPYDSPDGRKWRYSGQFTQLNTNFCLDLADGSVGGRVQIWDCHDQCHPDYNNQVWDFTYH